MSKRNHVKEFLDGSPLALGAVVFAAVASFLLGAVEQGLRLWDRVTASKPPFATIQVASQSGYVMVTPSEEMRKIPVIQNMLDMQKKVAHIFKKPKTQLATGQIPLWPVELLVLNPTKEKLNLHSCNMTAQLPRMKGLPHFSFGYFVSDTLTPSATALEQLVLVDPEGARKIQLIFVFADIEIRLRLAPDSKIAKFDLFNPAHIDIVCKDQALRELRTRHPIYSFAGWESTKLQGEQ